jgi:hypothetical protein
MSATVDLAQQNRPEVTLSLSGQSWTIRRVVLATYQYYQVIIKSATDAQERFSELRDRLTSGAADDTDITAMQQEIVDEAEKRQEMTYRCIESILTANGYEFDREWWDANSDRHEQHGFIAAALNKDMQGVSGGSSKKKEDG